MKHRHLLLSLHDVTPFHLERVVRAEHFLASAGVTRATYLLVPRFHGHWAVEHDRAFVAWCRAPRAFDVRWFLHGFYHSQVSHKNVMGSGTFSLEAAWTPKRSGRRARAMAGDISAGEGEFVELRGNELRSRLALGVESFRLCFHRSPDGFVAPAWLWTAELLPALREFGIAVTEDRRRVYDVAAGQRLSIPVITWAARTRLRRFASRLLAPLLLEYWAEQPAIRIAVHPTDLDDPATRRSVAQILSTALHDRELAFYDEIPYFASTRSSMWD